jgi:hypothetical protein
MSLVGAEFPPGLENSNGYCRVYTKQTVLRVLTYMIPICLCRISFDLLLPSMPSSSGGLLGYELPFMANCFE